MKDELSAALKRVTFAVDNIHPSKKFTAWSGPRAANTVSIAPRDLRTIIVRLRELEVANDNKSNQAGP